MSVAGFAYHGGSIACRPCQRRKPREWQSVVPSEVAAGLACSFCGSPLVAPLEFVPPKRAVEPWLLR